MGIYNNTPAAKSRKIDRMKTAIRGPEDFPVGFQERFSASFNSIRQRHTPRGNANVIGDKIAQRNQIIADNDLTNLVMSLTDAPLNGGSTLFPL